MRLAMLVMLFLSSIVLFATEISGIQFADHDSAYAFVVDINRRIFGIGYDDIHVGGIHLIEGQHIVEIIPDIFVVLTQSEKDMIATFTLPSFP